MLLRAEERARGLRQEFSGGLFLGTTQSHPLLTLPLPCYVTLRITEALEASIFLICQMGGPWGKVPLRHG